MEKKRISVEICMGSACFARGNNKLSSELGKLLGEEGLESGVYVKGATCMGLCKDGPVVKVNGEPYFRMTAKKLVALLAKMAGEKSFA